MNKKIDKGFILSCLAVIGVYITGIFWAISNYYFALSRYAHAYGNVIHNHYAFSELVSILVIFGFMGVMFGVIAIMEYKGIKKTVSIYK